MSLERDQVILIRLPSPAVNRLRSSKCRTTGTSVGEKLRGLYSLGARDFILRGLVTFKICFMPSYEWAMVTEAVHQLKLLQLPKFNNHSPTMAQDIAIYQKHMTT